LKKSRGVYASLVLIASAAVCLSAQSPVTALWDRPDPAEGVTAYITKIDAAPEQTLDYATACPDPTGTCLWSFTAPEGAQVFSIAAVTPTARSAFASVPFPGQEPTQVPSPEPVPDPTPQPPAPTPMASPDGTLIPPATQIIDAEGATWTVDLVTAIIERNGVQAAGGLGTILCWSGGKLSTLGIDHNWWQWSGAWTNIGPSAPSGCVAPTPIPTPTPAPAPPPAPPPVPTWTCSIPSVVKSYANGDKQVTLRCPKSFPGIKGNSVTVTVP